MTNEEFQKLVLQKLSNIEERQNNMETSLSNLEKRQDEIYQVVKAIEHSNQVGKAEIDRHEFRISKVEGKFKKVSKILDEDIDAAANL
ncbi:MAG TPA: M domain protein [Pseudobacteroides sp.]|uniref:M domain protein n=1 Tax=Pseudobacteroides sp. TaxID=1968840 RepID=UPI002F948120